MTVVSLDMAYRSFREVLAGFDTRLDTPPSIKRRHPDSRLALHGIPEGAPRQCANCFPLDVSRLRVRPWPPPSGNETRIFYCPLDFLDGAALPEGWWGLSKDP